MGYTYYMAIDAQASAIGANETDFSVALVLTSANLKTVANGGDIQNTVSGGASGSLTVPADFVVSPNSDGSSPYDFEVVAFDASTGAIEFWVEISSLSSSSDNTIYLCYGDSNVTTSQEDVAGTWGNSYEAVYHLGEASGTLYDSAGNNNSTSESLSSYGVTGKIGNAAEFGGSHYIYLGDLSLGEDKTFSIEAWAQSDTTNADRCIFSEGYSDSECDFLFLRQSSSDHLSFGYRDHGSTMSTAEGSAAFGTGWHRVAFVGHASNDLRSYLDGSEEATCSTSLGTTYLDNASIGLLRYGKDPGLFQYWDGVIDEVLLSTVTRDADWIASQYNNQNDPTPDSTFWGALGSEQGGRVPPWGGIATFQDPAVM